MSRASVNGCGAAAGGGRTSDASRLRARCQPARSFRLSIASSIAVTILATSAPITTVIARSSATAAAGLRAFLMDLGRAQRHRAELRRLLPNANAGGSIGAVETTRRRRLPHAPAASDRRSAQRPGALAPAS